MKTKKFETEEGQSLTSLIEEETKVLGGRLSRKSKNKKTAASRNTIVTVTKNGYAKLPEYKTKGSAGADVYANITMPLWIKPGEIKLIPTGLKVKIPEGYCIKLYPRSGLALGKGISLINCTGILDSDYRDEVGVALINHGTEQFEVKRGDRIAQMILEKVEQISWDEVTEQEWNEILEKESNDRQGGFGSTGV